MAIMIISRKILSILKGIHMIIIIISSKNPSIYLEHPYDIYDNVQKDSVCF